MVRAESARGYRPVAFGRGIDGIFADIFYFKGYLDYFLGGIGQGWELRVTLLTLADFVQGTYSHDHALL